MDKLNSGYGAVDNNLPNNSVANENNTSEELSFAYPVAGNIYKVFSKDTPVFSNTLNEWRIHTGLDISAAEGTEVHACEKGTVTNVYSNASLGQTIEIYHENGVVTKYSNLANNVTVSKGDAVDKGELIGYIGRTSLVELADEPHLHLEFIVDGDAVNPLDYIQ